MTWEISKQYHFSSAHRLTGLAPEHPCMRQHGHNYIAEITLRGDRINEQGMLVDYLTLDNTIGAWIEATLDHRDLNAVYTKTPTTAELLAREIYWKCATYEWGGLVTSVTVKESDKTKATFYHHAQRT